MFGTDTVTISGPKSIKSIQKLRKLRKFRKIRYAEMQSYRTNFPEGDFERTEMTNDVL